MYSEATLYLSVTLPCVDSVYFTMGNVCTGRQHEPLVNGPWFFPHVNSIPLFIAQRCYIYNLGTLCLNGTRPCFISRILLLNLLHGP